MGHIAQALEENGISTVVIAVEAFKDTLLSMSLPRILITPFSMGSPMGFPGNSSQHLRVIKEAINLLTEETQSKTIVTIDDKYLRKD